MTPIILSRGVRRNCNDSEIAYLNKHIREMVDEMEVKNPPPVFCPYPPDAEKLEKHKDCQIQVTFFPINPGKLNRMVMIIPLFIKEDNCNTWYVQMKDEFGKIELDIRTPLHEGHHRVTRKK